MLQIEPVVSIIRFLDPKSDKDTSLPKFCATCTLLWESKDVIWIKGLTGTLTRQHIKSFAKFLIDNKITLVKAIRVNGSLPFSTKVEGTYCEIDVIKQLPLLQKFSS